jgi:hypothetical protein
MAGLTFNRAVDPSPSPGSLSVDAQSKLSGLISNVFCPTGDGGGIDPSCSLGSGSGGAKPEGQFEDPSGFYPRRNKVPKVGYHITDIENIEGIARQGLIPQSSTTGGGGSGKVAGVYFVDKLLPKGHSDAPETLHENSIVLRARTGHVNGALDDTEVREFEGYKGDPNKSIGDKSAFLVGQRIDSSLIDVMSKEGKRQWTPLKEFVKTEEYRRIVKSNTHGVPKGGKNTLLSEPKEIKVAGKSVTLKPSKVRMIGLMFTWERNSTGPQEMFLRGI